MLPTRLVVAFLLLTVGACTGTSEPSATTLSPAAVRARVEADTVRLRAVPMPLRGSIETWLNTTGLAQLDPNVWQVRLDRLCAQEFWANPPVLQAHGDEFVAADRNLSILDPEAEPLEMKEVYRMLWVMALNHCRELVPVDFVEAGPPDTAPGG